MDEQDVLFDETGEKCKRERTSSEISSSPSRQRFLVEQVQDEPLPASPEKVLDDIWTPITGDTLTLKKGRLTTSDELTIPRSPTPEKHGSRPISMDFMDATMTNGYTLGFPTAEAIPMTMFYRNMDSNNHPVKNRPTLDELRKGFDTEEQQAFIPDNGIENGHSTKVTIETKIVPSGKPAVKFGWLKGVMLRCLLNIWGVMLYLRLPWVYGQSGALWGSVIVLLSAAVTIFTTLSMSAICTNGEVKGGGAYYLISRSLGPEFGGSIGLIFSVANAVAISLYVVGFAETVRDILKENDSLMVDEINDIRIIGIISMLFLVMVTLIGLEWVVRTQMFLLGILVISIIDVIIGTFLGPLSDKIESQGFVGYNMTLLQTNVVSDYSEGENFFTVFAIFFPAATGILAGVNISGDLKNAQTALPKGTLWAILISTVVYLLLGWMISAAALRNASGMIMTEVINGSFSNVTAATFIPSCAEMLKCDYGLMNDFQIMEKVAAWGPIVTGGIFAATLSSALASLVGAPKTFQAVCKDNIFPGIGFFAKGVGQGDEPRRGYVLSFLIAVGFIAIGELNVIAPLISNFFLMSYALINYSCFASSLGKSPGWRPSFKYYNMWVSLIGSLVCVAIMFLINKWTALVTIVIVASLYKYVDYKKPKDTNWGSSTQAYAYIKALQAAYHMNNIQDHTKNYRPQCLVLTGKPSSRPDLPYFASHFTKNVGLLVCGQVVVTDGVSKLRNIKDEDDWLRKHKIRGFHTVIHANSFRSGVFSLLQVSGLGKLKPNILMLGFKTEWTSCSHGVIEEYVGIISDAFDLNYGITVLRVPEGFDITNDTDVADPDWDEDQEIDRHVPLGKQLDKQISDKVNKVKGTIDVWWLFDDGGLTILLPYLLTNHSFWKDCTLRIFTQKSSKNSIQSAKLRMANLLKKFRIEFSSIVELEGINQKPSRGSIDDYKKLTVSQEAFPNGTNLDVNTLRQIRLGELLRINSADAKLVVVTLPVPRTSLVSPLVYMSWLEVLSADLPPTLLIRGNQASVLTFYS